jgi:hypothetical protein
LFLNSYGSMISQFSSFLLPSICLIYVFIFSILHYPGEDVSDLLGFRIFLGSLYLVVAFCLSCLC